VSAAIRSARLKSGSLSFTVSNLVRFGLPGFQAANWLRARFAPDRSAQLNASATTACLHRLEALAG
jgi:hypothetical protein